MIGYVIKRDGRKVDFNDEKIARAIFKAFKACCTTDIENSVVEFLTKKVVDRLENDDFPTVEGIQDYVIQVLKENSYHSVAEEYESYRESRTRIREMNTYLMQIYEDITFKDAENSDIKRENVNIDADA